MLCAAPKYVVKKGKTPVLNTDEARALLDSTDISTPIGLCDRALIGVMVYTFARVNAVISMKVKDYFTQGRRGWVSLHDSPSRATFRRPAFKCRMFATYRSMETRLHERKRNQCQRSRWTRGVVTDSHDRSLQVWDLATGESKKTLLGHSGSIIAVAVTRDSRYVVSGSGSRERSDRLYSIPQGSTR
jgi:WD40 repeat protein